MSLIACLFVPWGLVAGDNVGGYFTAILLYLLKLAAGAALLALFETGIAKMRVFRVPQFLGAALMLGLLGTLLLFVSRSI
jgi:formate hydrogenlyase subunit 4